MQYYDNVEGNKTYLIQPGASKITIDYYAPAQSGPHTDDGVIRYGETMSSVTATIYDSDGLDATSDMQYALPSIDGDYILYTINYPASGKTGLYRIELVITTDQGSTIPVVIKRVRAVVL